MKRSLPLVVSLVLVAPAALRASDATHPQDGVLDAQAIWSFEAPGHEFPGILPLSIREETCGRVLTSGADRPSWFTPVLSSSPVSFGPPRRGRRPDRGKTQPNARAP